jgi:hypothetical protein
MSSQQLMWQVQHGAQSCASREEAGGDSHHAINVALQDGRKVLEAERVVVNAVEAGPQLRRTPGGQQRQ